MDLATLLHPQGVADFLVRIYGLEPLCVPGSATRFAALWPASVPLDQEVNLEAADQTFPNLADLAAVLERTFETEVTLRLRVSLNESPEFTALHDLLVVGITSGELRYIPQGQTCNASGPGAELHIEILNPTGYDLVHWVLDAMRDQPALRAAMPLLAGPDRRADFTQNARKLVGSVMRSVELFDKFQWHRFAAANLRTLASETFDASPATTQLMHLAANRPLRPQLGEDDTIYVILHGRALRFGVEAAAFIHYLNTALPGPVAAFYQQFGDEYTQTELADFLAVAAQSGLIVFRDPSSLGVSA